MTGNDLLGDDRMRSLVLSEIAAGRAITLEELVPAPEVDLRTLLGEMAALRREVRQETTASRSVRDQTLELLAELRAERAGATARQRAREEQLQQAAARLDRELAPPLLRRRGDAAPPGPLALGAR
ncbi:MAG: hypothetical protein HYV63_23315 [Candidatus Schekmanbacteria bacterium]|nr:hypothetical protein [Candidatus Schekmanbacteria bacterium]